MKTCKACGKCCEYIVVDVGLKTTETIKWLEYHDIEYKEGWIKIPLKCKHLTKDGKCLIHEDPNRSIVCKNYTCEKHKLEWKIPFAPR